MFSLETLEIDLKAMQEDSFETSCTLGDAYFESLDEAEIDKGKINVQLAIRKSVAGAFSLTIGVTGSVTVQCDRCLDDMDQPVEGESSYIVKLGQEPSDDGETIVVDENEGILSVAWLIYETTVLAIPIKHVHAPGKCNDAMTKKLEELSATRSGDEEAKDTIDPRWAELAKLKQ